MGLVNHYYNLRALAEDPGLPTANHRFRPGDTGGLVIASTASVIKGTDSPEAAARLIEFLLGEGAQRYFADETFEYPLRPGVPPAAGIAPLEDLRPPGYDVGASADLETTARLIRDSGLR
jgi:iron(III) transport system substrate-binding protein